MSELTQFRDYCRRMAVDRKSAIPVTQRDRELWTMLADEVDNYLAGPALPSDEDHDPIDFGVTA